MKAAALLCGLLLLGPAAAPARPAGPLITGRFNLVDAQSGAKVSEGSYLGKRRLVFFGFTHCPLTCPLGMRTLDGILKSLGPRAAGWQALFITIDPRRDSAPVVSEYLKAHDARIRGLVGKPSAVQSAMRSFRLEAERLGEGKDYVLEHPAIIYVMEKDGSYLGTLPSSGDPAELAERLKAWENEAR